MVTIKTVEFLEKNQCICSSESHTDMPVLCKIHYIIEIARKFFSFGEKNSN